MPTVHGSPPRGSRGSAGPALPSPTRASRKGGQEAFERLSQEIRSCQLCPLALTRLHAVVYRGSFRPRVVFVGEAPGEAEDRAGVPFVGRAGRLLDHAISELGPALGPHGVLNLLKCRPPKNRFDPAAARTCRPYLDRQLALLRPEALVPMGARALAALDPSAPPILRSAGVPRQGPTGRLFPLLHPAAALRSRRWRERWETDVRALAAWLQGPALETL